MDDFEPSPEARARALRAAEGILMPGRQNDQKRFWFEEGYLSREQEVMRWATRADTERRIANSFSLELKHERERIDALIKQLEMSGDGYVRYALECYRKSALDE